MKQIKIKGYRNTWTEMDFLDVNGIRYYLMENDTYGDETNYLVINKNQDIILETYDDIETTLVDNDIMI